MDMQNSISITLNGEPRAIAAGLNVQALVFELGLDLRKIAIERNLEIVPRTAYAEVPLMEGDLVEIVQFIGGG